MKQINFVGIDVSLKELVVKIAKDGDIQPEVHQFFNTKVGHKKLIKFIKKGGRQARVCLEATGIYHFNLSLSLYHAKGIEIMVVNPKAIKHFGIASMSRAKTDTVDAGVILHYLMKMDFVAWKPPRPLFLDIQSITRRIFQLKGEVNREKNRRHAEESGKNGGIINNDIDVNIRHLKRRIKSLEEKGVELVHSDAKLHEVFTLLTSIKGVAVTSGLQILAELICLPEDMQAEQWVAYAGLDPRAVQSGESMDKPRHITKAGNKYLRTALYMPAMVAVRHDKHVKAFYDKLIGKGKKPMQATVAVMRKLLHAIWGMLNSGSVWDGSKFYPGGNDVVVAASNVAVAA